MDDFDRETAKLRTFVELLADHELMFASFVRDIENVRYGLTPVDTQQLRRIEYALNNMDLRLLLIEDATQVAEGAVKHQLVDVMRSWRDSKTRVDRYMTEILTITARTKGAIGPLTERM